MHGHERATTDQRGPAYLPVTSVDEGWTPLQAFVLIKALDDDGQTAWSFPTSEPMNLEELLGALTIQVDVLRRKLVRQWEDEDDAE